MTPTEMTVLCKNFITQTSLALNMCHSVYGEDHRVLNLLRPYWNPVAIKHSAHTHTWVWTVCSHGWCEFLTFTGVKGKSMRGKKRMNLKTNNCKGTNKVILRAESLWIVTSGKQESKYLGGRETSDIEFYWPLWYQCP